MSYVNTQNYVEVTKHPRRSRLKQVPRSVFNEVAERTRMFNNLVIMHVSVYGVGTELWYMVLDNKVVAGFSTKACRRDEGALIFKTLTINHK